MIVIKDKYGMWSTPCSNKDKTCTYWLSVGFKNEPNADKKVFIEPVKSFHTAYAKKDGTPCPKLYIMEWKYSEKPDEVHAQVNGGSFMFEADDLPF